jgi:hypothetical protein
MMIQQVDPAGFVGLPPASTASGSAGCRIHAGKSELELPNHERYLQNPNSLVKSQKV